MKTNNRFEINDLIDDAVNNAVARRNEALLSLSDEEAQNVTGGGTSPTVLGVVIDPIPPIVHGIIIHGIILGIVIDPPTQA